MHFNQAMVEFFRKLFSTDFMPHVYCLRQPDVIWLHVCSDLLIAASYFTIPLGLLVIAKRHPGLPYRRAFMLFGAFILACGATHLIAVVTLWHPMYRFEGVVKAITALLSAATAILLIRMIPRIVKMLSTEQRLGIEIHSRREAEKLNTKLKEGVLLSTFDLKQSQLDLDRLNHVLLKSETSFRNMIEASPSAMAMADSKGRIEMVNTGMEHMFCYTRPELLGMSIEKLVTEKSRSHDPESPGSVARSSSLPLLNGREFCGLRKNGKEFPFEISFNSIETETGTKVLWAIIDVSFRREKEERVQAALKEKDVLLGEIHHRVKNNLQIVHSLLDLQSSQISDSAVVAMLRDSQNRIRSMALIHQTLYQSKDFARVDFGLFLESLVPTLVQSYLDNAERVILSIHADDVHLPIDMANPCGLLINELVSNSLKHAFPGDRRGKITIDFVREAGDDVVLTVSDNGVGIAEDFDMTQTTTLGLQLVFLLTDQLHGEMDIHRRDPTCFTLRFSTKGGGLKDAMSESPAMVGVADD